MEGSTDTGGTDSGATDGTDVVSGTGGTDGTEVAGSTDVVSSTDGADMELFDLRVTVDRIEGRSVCGMQVGDHFDLVRSNELRLPEGRHFCIYALQAVLPLLPAKQRQLPAGDWLEKDNLVACPDPDERLIMRIERTGRCQLRSGDLT